MQPVETEEERMPPPNLRASANRAASAAALAGRGQFKIQADTAMPTNPWSPMLASNCFRSCKQAKRKKRKELRVAA